LPSKRRGKSGVKNIERFGILKENAIAVVQYEEPRLAIHRWKGVVRLCLIEDLCESGELLKHFPIDIANLEFCGQGFIMAEPFAIDGGHGPREQRLAGLDLVVPETAPRRQEDDGQAELVALFDDVIEVSPGEGRSWRQLLEHGR
jgi:hypothetical protein